MIDKASERWTVCFAAILFALSSAVASAATFHIDISPAPRTALNLNGVNLYNGDHAVGLSEANAIVPGGSGSGTGNETGPGITYDDVSQELNLNFDYSGLFGTNPAVRFQGISAVNFPGTNLFNDTVKILGPHDAGFQESSVSGVVIVLSNDQEG